MQDEMRHTVSNMGVWLQFIQLLQNVIIMVILK